MQRVRWIDFLRGISMIMILIFHTETYYKENDITPYYFYTTNAIILFYVISGWLFYKEAVDFSLKHKAKSIFHSMVIPYFLFTALIAVPKLLIRHQVIEWQEIIENILLGRASWFIAALIVAELLFSLFLVISKGKNKLLLPLAVICIIIYFIIPFNVHNIWQWQDALLAVFFLYTGYLCHQNKQLMNYINKPLYSILLLSLLIMIKIVEYKVDLPMRNIAIENVLLFLADALIWLFLVLSIISYIPHSRLIEWTGRHSIVYYFLAGGVPLLVSKGLNYLSLTNHNSLSLLLAICLVYLIATIIVWMIDRLLSLFNLNRYIRI